MKQIPVGKGKFALVDDEDFEELSKYSWNASSTGYARRSGRPHEGGKNRKIYMHRQISRALEHEEVDHADCNQLNNQRANLRICDHTHNLANRRTNKNNKLGVKGVVFRANRFESMFFHQGKEVFRKRFKTLEEAKAAYDHHHRIYHGEYSRS